MKVDGIGMRIGIDIDNTLTDIEEELMEAASNYARQLNKNFVHDYRSIADLQNDGNIYKQLFDFNEEELKYFLGPIQENIQKRALPREGVVEVIDHLRQFHFIYIITARDFEFHENPYKDSEDWLNKNDIYFDKLIVNARDKGKICAKHKIDLLIDDNIQNCIRAHQYGIDVILFGKTKYKGIKNCETWKQVYEYIQKISKNNRKEE